MPKSLRNGTSRRRAREQRALGEGGRSSGNHLVPHGYQPGPAHGYHSGAPAMPHGYVPDYAAHVSPPPYGVRAHANDGLVPVYLGPPNVMMQPPTPDLGSALRLVQKNILPMLLGMTLAVMLGLAYLLVTKPTYSASASLFIDPRSRKVVSEDVIQSGSSNDVALFESQVAIVSSDATLRRVVDSERLTENPLFVPPQVERGVVGQMRDKILGPRLLGDPTTTALMNLSRALRVRRAQNTYVVNVDVATGDPVLSAKLANAIAQAYLEDQAFAKSEAARKANALIDGRLGELKEQVRVAELKVDAFRRANQLVTSEGGMLNEQQLTRLNNERASVQANLATARARLSELESIQRRGGGNDSLPEALASPTIQRLRDQYAQVSRREAALASQLQPRHPILVDARAQTAALRTQIQQELARISDGVRNEVQVNASREDEIQRTLKRLQDEVQQTTTSQIRLREIEREAEASREIYRAYLTRAKETSEQQNTTVADARIITPASVPIRPASPNAILVLIGSALAGLGLGLSRAILHSVLQTGAPATAIAGAGATAVPMQPGANGPEPRPTTPLARQRRVRLQRMDMAGQGPGGDTQAPVAQASKFAQDPASAIEPITGEVPVLGTLSTLARREAMSPGLARAGSIDDGGTLSLGDVLGALAEGRRPVDKAFQTETQAVVDRLRDLARPGEPLIALLASAEREQGTTTAALAIAYSASLAGHRVLLVDAASATADLSLVFAPDLAQDHPCVLDNKAHLAEITWFDSRSGLGLLPIALADIRRMTPTQRRRFGVGLSRLAKDYDLVVIDGGSVAEDQAIAPLTAVATIVVPVVAEGADLAKSSGRVLGALGTGIDQMPGAIRVPVQANSSSVN